MASRPLPGPVERQRIYQDWEFGLAARGKQANGHPEQLPSEVVQAWDDMNAAWRDIKDHGDETPNDARRRFDDANQRLRTAWAAMTASKSS